MRILLIEDDRMIGTAVQQALKDAAYAVDWVTDGETAIHAAESEAYEVALLDLGLPKADGRDVLRRLRGLGRKLPVIIVTAREFALLQALLARPGMILSRSELERQIYGWNEEVESNAVEFLIHTIRKKLGAAVIRNVRGVGWMVDRPS